MIRAKPWPDTPSPREQRDIQRLQRASQAVPRGQNSAMETALAQIGAAFDEAAVINAFKIRVERLLRLGPHHPTVRARFGARAQLLLGRGLEAAAATVERWWRDERKAFQIASAFGCASRLSLEILSELRLILRLMRWKRMQSEYEAILAGLWDASVPTAAE